MFALPIDETIPEILNVLHQNQNLVVIAPPGAGKTTRVPVALLDAEIVSHPPATTDVGQGDRLFKRPRQVVVLQPRRVAARAVSRRIADERGCLLGAEIGYHIRFDRKFGPQTRLLTMTEGVLVRRLLADPFLDGIDVVVFDEFHERHLDTDLSLAMCRRVQQTVRPDLKLIVMSATLAANPVAKYLGDCPVITCEGTRFPVAVSHQAPRSEIPLPIQAAQVASELCHNTPGDILVFLPGVREIRQAQDELQRLGATASCAVLPLYGDLSAEEQDRALALSSQRKIVLATNVAETSLTIPGVTAVVDTGVARVKEFDPASGLDRLVLKPISKASADQRAGRAGRTAPGHSVRLWPDVAHRHRPDHEMAEIHRVDLSGVVLQLLDWGEADPRSFPWFERPSDSAFDAVDRLLHQLEALDDRGLTPLGRQLASLPLAPRLARLMIEGSRAGDSHRSAVAAALLSERDPFQREDRPSPARHRSRSDLLDRIEALTEYERSGRTHFDIGTLHRGGADFVLRAAAQIEQSVKGTLHRQDSSGSSKPRDPDEPLLRAILAGFPDRVARRREPLSRKAVMVGGRGVRLGDQSAVGEAELFVCLDVDGEPGGRAAPQRTGNEALVRMASFVDRSWLQGTCLTTQTDVEFDASHERVQARRRVRWNDLVLEESTAPLPEGDEAANVLANAALSVWDRVRPRDDAALGAFLARVTCLRTWLPECGIPELNDESLKQLLPEICLGRRSFSELQQGPWLDLLRRRLTSSQLQVLDREAPERIQVPSGSRIAIHYEIGRPPVLAVRIQEIFGWTKTPRIAGGRVPILLHLLAPNHRPQQITDDLASFWKNGYPVIRGELRRRYPKHAWPDDPLNAEPEHRPQRQKSPRK